MCDRKLWEILVPCSWNTGKPVRKRHHQEWDKVVRRIAGGLTIYKPANGQWVDNNTLYAERMIPVRIACTEKQITRIAKFSLSHYRQLAVIVYALSERVMIIKNDEKRKDKDVTDIHERRRVSD